MREVFYTVTADEDGRTVERVLRRRGLSHALLVHLKTAPDGLTLAGAQVYTNHVLRAGDHLRVRVYETVPNETITPAAMPISVVYEDEDVLIIDKPAGMAVHPSQGNRDSSLANALAARYVAQREPFVFRAIGRLDKNTSGLVLLAKNALSACLLSHAAARREVRREYLALCTGKLPLQGTIDAPIGRADGSTIARQVRADGDRAVTHFERISYQNDVSLTRIWLDTGRTHQIRVHMAYLGHALLGDFLYNPTDHHTPRHALHAARLTLVQPVTGQPLSFTSPLPEDLSLA